MSLADLEASRDGGAPVHLYQFSRGAELTRLAGIEGGLTVPAGLLDPGAALFEGAAISHGAVVSTQDLARADVAVTLPLDHPFAAAFIALAATRLSTHLTIFRADARAPEAGVAVLWKGRVTGHRIAGEAVELTVESYATALARRGGRTRLQRICDHPHYHGGCGLDLENWIEPGTASALDGFALTVAEAATGDVGRFRGGILRFAGVPVFILGQAGAILTLRAVPPGLGDAIAAEGFAAVEIAPGCDRSAAICAGRFDNLLNRRGFDHIPGAEQNPFGLRSIV